MIFCEKEKCFFFENRKGNGQCYSKLFYGYGKTIRERYNLHLLVFIFSKIHFYTELVVRRCLLFLFLNNRQNIPFCFFSFAAKSFVSFYHSKDDLIRDDKVEGKSDPEFSRMRRLLQNSMDGARYLSAELEFVSNFIVPLSSHPRRILEIVSNATGSWK